MDVRFRPGEIIRIRAERWRVGAQTRYDMTTIVDVTGVDVSNRGRPARFVVPFEPIERVPPAPAPRIVRPAEWRRIVRASLAAATPSPTALRTAARADVTLLPFQLEPAMAVVRGLGARVLIADAVGLGKTIQAGLIASEVLARTHDGHVLIVCPAGLRDQWQHELESKFALPSVRVGASALARSEALRHAGGNPWASHAVAIVSVDYLKRPEVIRGLEEMVWDLIVLDEAHALAGRSDRADAAALIAARARVVVMLTATPHSGDDRQFATLAGLGRLDGDGPLLVFRRTRADAGLASTRRAHWLPIALTPAERLMHAALDRYTRSVWRTHTASSRAARLAMIVLARRAASGACALARSVERRMTLLAALDESRTSQLLLPFAAPLSDDEEPMAELGAPGLADAAVEQRHLERLLTLARRAAPLDSKLARLRRFLQRVREPVIVFTEYRDTLEQVAATVGGLPLVQLHGGLTVPERRDAERRFTSGTAQLLLATDAASEGLNLHHRCRLVINLELPWTPLRLEQRVGRVDRIGQSRTVHAVHFVARGTAEDGVVQRLIRRDGHARTSLDAIARVDPESIARVAIGGETMPVVPEPSTPTGVTPDLRVDATAECARLARVRVLARGAIADNSRPIVTILRGYAGPRLLSAWMLPIVGRDEEWLWQSLVATAVPFRGVRPSAPADVRALLERIHVDAAAIAADMAPGALRSFLEATGDATAQALTREHAIAARITAERAAMAAALVQRSLFDRRAERRVAHASAALDGALSRCQSRIDRLRLVAAAGTEPPQLTFAVVLD